MKAITLGLGPLMFARAARGNSIGPLSLQPSSFSGLQVRSSKYDHVVYCFFLTITAQVVRLIPGTSATAANEIWAIIDQGCTEANPDLDFSSCAFARGGLFNPNASSTWSTSRLENNGLYALDLFEESELGLSANASFGFDDVSFGLPGSGLPKLQNQLIAGIATDDFFLGTIGLSPISQNFSSFNTPVPSLLGSLRDPNNSIVPSTTWAYTAGAVYQSPPVFGSLIFGGYDANRVDLVGGSTTVPFWTDPSRDLLLGLKSITYNTLGSSPLLVDGIYTFIDSLVAQMWLPLEVCQAFELAFGIEWDNVTEFYTVSDEAHANLTAQNPVFTFTVGPTNDQNGDNTVINIPYAAFDLNVSTPYYNQSQRYFPLKRAQNDTQYTLGRAFLQEAYVIADYDRRNFTVGQALFPSTEDIRAILPPGEFTHQPDHGLAKGAIAGIAVGAIVVVAALVAGIWWWLKKWSRTKGTKYAPASPDEKAPFGDFYPPEETSAAENTAVGELRGDYQYPELSAKKAHRGSELSGPGTDARFELPGVTRYELSAQDGVAAELEARR